MKWGAIVLLAGLLLPLGSGASAAGGGPYDLSWFTVASGSITAAAGGDYTLDGTAGQTAAGLLAGGEYSLVTGFLPCQLSATPPEHQVYLPLVIRAR